MRDKTKKLFLLAAAAVLVMSPLTAQEEMQSISDAKVDKMVDRAVDYLISQQQENGMITRGKQPIVSTSLAIMGLMSVGHTPTDDSKEGAVLRKALDFVLQDDLQEENGYFGRRDGHNSRMYGHGIVTLMLAEAVGMGVDDDQDRRIRERLTKAVDLILWSQKQKDPNNIHHYGGWRYEPNSGDSDLSVTVWQVLALRAAKDAGIEVPKEAIDLAVGYIKRCYHSQRDNDGNPTNLKSGCGYQVGHGPTYTSAAYGLLSLQVCGEYDSPEVKGSADWLMDQPVRREERFGFYGTYYYMQGMYQFGGKHAEHAKKNVEDLYYKIQSEDGSWPAHDGQEREAGEVYVTSMALLALSVNYNFLPIYQR